MKIAMFTNTYVPHLGGVARSVESFSRAYRERGHEVLVVAPEFPDSPRDEPGVLRLPAIRNFNSSDFSVVVPLGGGVSEALDRFQPDVVHAHHPFLLGMTALRMARMRELPLVFTHHTFHEVFTQYMPGDSPRMKRFAAELATRYANLADRVLAPSESVAAVLRQRGVTTPIRVLPTGVESERFAQGDGARFRRRLGIPAEAPVVGHVGRLAPEKNLGFLAESVAGYLEREPRAHFVVVGKGPMRERIEDVLARASVPGRWHLAGEVVLPELADALNAMDVFVFCSKRETQGMVLTEAMAAGVPVVALSAMAVGELVRDGVNGRLVEQESPAAFADAIASVVQGRREELEAGALRTAERYSMAHTATSALEEYEALRAGSAGDPEADPHWERILHWIEAEWEILKGLTGAGRAALAGEAEQ